MGVDNGSKHNHLSTQQEQSYEQLIGRLKIKFFCLTNAHLVQNQNSSPFMYYLFLFLEHLALLWFILHPGLAIFGSVFLLSELRVALLILNFQQLLKVSQQVYQTIVIVILIYLLIQIALIVASCYNILHNSNKEYSKYLKKIVNFLLILNVRVLSGPVLGLAVNILYCQENSPYKLGQTCYNPLHVMFCILSAIIALMWIVQIVFFSLFYFIKNPLTASYMGEYNRYYILSKTLIKILLPVYFAVDYRQTLGVIFISLLAALWGFYIFWHRLFSTHSYEQKHFYVQYFMESTVAWMAVNNVLSYYIQGKQTQQKMNLVYSLFTSVLIAILLLNIQKNSESKFIEECLQKKMKKQNMERFVFILIHKFLHKSSKQSKLTFLVYSRLISKNIPRFKQIGNQLQSPEKADKHEIYRFLYVLVESYLQQNNSVILKTLKCYFLNYLGQKTYGLHQSLELQNQRLGIVDEFMLFQFKINQNVFESDKLDKVGVEFNKCYLFYEQLQRLEALIEICAANNMEYWDQLCQADPSLSKLRSLATVYTKSYGKIKMQYDKAIEQFSQNLSSTNFYLNFLMNVAVDTKQTIRIKQKLASLLENRSRISKNAELNLAQDQDISIMTLNSIGNNLGIISNCNKVIEQSLGFQKSSLIGKNVTKLMPKIYTELHNTFMMNFIKNQASHEKQSEKLVAALNKNSLLVQMKLTARVMATTESALAVVGFMKTVLKSGEEKQKGLLMFSLNNAMILGVDSQFEKIMNKKVTGKQIIQDEIKLTSIMPELNLQQFEKERVASTVLEVGSIVQSDDMETQMTKQVILELRSTKYYEGVNIAFMTVTQAKYSKNSNALNLEDHIVSLTKIASPNFLQLISEKQKQVRTDVSIYFDGDKMRQEDGLVQQLPLAKKIEQYVENKQNSQIKIFVRVVYIVAILGCISLSLTFYLTHRDKLTQMAGMYTQMNQTTYMSHCVARVNLLTNLIWSVERQEIQPNYSRWWPQFTDDYDSLRDTFRSLVTATKKYQDNLQFNKLLYYSINYYTYAKDNYVFSILVSTNVNLYNIYLKSSGAFFYTNLTSPMETINLQLQALFVKSNGQQIIPNILRRATNLYQTFFNKFVREQFRRMAFLKAGFLILSIAAIALVSYVGIYVNRTVGQVVKIYKNIRLWDISELSSKCKVFLGAMGVKISKKRTSSLLRIFPRRTFLQLINQQKQKQTELVIPNDNSQVISKKGLSQELSFREAMSPNQLLTPSILNETNQLIDNQQSFLRGNDFEPTVQLFWQQRNKKIILATLGLILLVVLPMVASMYFQDKYTDKLYDEIEMLRRVGGVKSIINYINYFSYRILQNSNDTRARLLLNQYISQFYQYSKLTSKYLGDPEPSLKKIYTYIQAIQQWLAVPNNSTQNIFLANYSTIYQGLKQGCQSIQNLSQTVFLAGYLNVLRDKQTSQLVSAIFLLVIVCLLLLLIHWLYLSPIYKQSRHSLNMVNILPAWIFQRNSQALDFLVQ